MIVELAVTAGPHAGRSFRFAEHATFIVGRSSQAHFSLPDKDPHVSRLHLLVEVNPPLCRLRNMSAVNGTVVNGSKVSETDLKDGDRITIGVTEVTVRLQAGAGDATPTVGLPATGPFGFGSDPVVVHTRPFAPAPRTRRRPRTGRSASPTARRPSRPAPTPRAARVPA